MSTEEVQETETASEEVIEEPVTVLQVTTDSAINTPLDEVEDPETLKKMIKKLRGENAKSRTEKNSQKSELEEFRAWKESQMTELEKAQARIAELEERNSSVAREAVLAKYGIDEDDDLAEFVTGTREEMETKAAKLSERLRTKEADPVPDLFKNSSRGPVKTQTKDDGAAFLEFLAENGSYTS